MVGQWQLSDAWVFAAIEGSGVGDGYTLMQVIAKGDSINHAVIAEEEFCRAVPRLVAAGLIGADLAADRYWRTDKGNALYKRCMKRRGLFGLDRCDPTRATPPRTSTGRPLESTSRRVRKRRPRSIQAGRVVELGTPAVLLARDGAYSALAA